MAACIAVYVAAGLSSCHSGMSRPQRPGDPWAFRSVLDQRPRMLTLALDSDCYMAYDLAACEAYRVWKGGVSLQGAAYTSRKTVQPTSWGHSYLPDSLHRVEWIVKRGEDVLESRAHYRGYLFREGRIYLHFALQLASGDTLSLEESPEFFRTGAGFPGLERQFRVRGLPPGLTLLAAFPDTTFTVHRDGRFVLSRGFPELPDEQPPRTEPKKRNPGQVLVEHSDCLLCHETDEDAIGPSFRKIAGRYGKEDREYLARKIAEGGTGVWGRAAMSPHPSFSNKELEDLTDYILSFKPEEKSSVEQTAGSDPDAGPAELSPLPPLDGVHPSYSLSTLHRNDFKPRVGGLAFLPDRSLLVTTWDSVGGVYRLEGVETADTNRIRITRIASGLAEPLGIEVVNGEIYVLQKQELTHLIDHDGDGIIDEYRVVCADWGATADFHEFAFGLVFQNGSFYATLSMAMRLKKGEQQHQDRGRTIRIGLDGSMERINYGLRTPNGIGLGPDSAIFVTDNQGQWLPAGKLIHVRKGDYLGMGWGLPPGLSVPPEETPPVLWLPQDEIANSPSEPVLLQDGRYKGQLLFGDVTHGGIKRCYLEKVNGRYQGSVFRFSQGFAAGVNRLCIGPDGALYAGEIGMGGSWSWHGTTYGLQRLSYTGAPAFEMLKVSARSGGFELCFTEPLASDALEALSEIEIRQWRYKATKKYGGPKLDYTALPVAAFQVSSDRTRIHLDIPGLKEGYVVYFRLPENLASAGGRALWSREAWYTLNSIPQ